MGSAAENSPTSNLSASIIPFQDLEPAWHTPGAKEGGFMRWLVSWVGGPKGYVNGNLGRAVQSENISVGFMRIYIGQRQKGLHYHSITEIYVIIKGQLKSYDGSGNIHTAGPMDCVYIPPGVPHGVRNSGTEDVEMIWLHDGLEKKGVTVYCETEADIQAAPSKKPIQIVRLRDLEPNWSFPRAKEPEFLRWVVNWVGGYRDLENCSRGKAIESDRIAIGLTVILPGHKSVPHQHSTAEIYVVIGGKALVNLGQGNKEVSYLDGIYFPPGEVHSLRNHGPEPVYVFWVHERPQKLGDTKY